MKAERVFGSIVLAVLLMSSLGCEAIQKKLNDMQAARGAALVEQGNRAKPMFRDAERSDGYQMISRHDSTLSNIEVGYDAGGGKFDESLKGKRFKVCTNVLYRVLPEPGEILDHWAKEPIEQLVREKKLRDDRYYALDHHGSGVGGVFLAIPASERAEFVKNVEEGGGYICYWSEGQIESFPSSKDGKTMYFVEVSRWDGVLKPHEPMEAPAPGSPAGSATP